jgi:hypothetical protein
MPTSRPPGQTFAAIVASELRQVIWAALLWPWPFYEDWLRVIAVHRIIAEAGVAKATLHAHSRSKDELIQAVLKHRDNCTSNFFGAAMRWHRRPPPNASLRGLKRARGNEPNIASQARMLDSGHEIWFN